MQHATVPWIAAAHGLASIAFLREQIFVDADLDLELLFHVREARSRARRERAQGRAVARDAIEEASQRSGARLGIAAAVRLAGVGVVHLVRAAFVGDDRG